LVTILVHSRLNYGRIWDPCDKVQGYALGFRPNVRIVLKHLAADVSCDCHNGLAGRQAFCEFGYAGVAEVMKANRRTRPRQSGARCWSVIILETTKCPSSLRTVPFSVVAAQDAKMETPAK
jgi:hypothetical protein